MPPATPMRKGFFLSATAAEEEMSMADDDGDSLSGDPEDWDDLLLMMGCCSPSISRTGSIALDGQRGTDVNVVPRRERARLG